MALTLLDLLTGQVARTTLQENFDRIKNAINAGVTALGADSVTAAAHADLSANITKTMHSGKGVKITDAANYFAGDDDEEILAELGAALGMAAGVSTGLKIFGFATHASDPTALTPIVVPADKATTLIAIGGCFQALAHSAGTYSIATETCQYTIQDAAAADAFVLRVALEAAFGGGVNVSSTTCAAAKITPTAGKTTTFNYIAASYTGTTYGHEKFWLCVVGY
ncbi:hypothetical protein [Sulfuricurvum sp.]|uniref:hypothetical protein n=1 Tax=Sulfuricurvum sp. TaxID=2025608 RepID=UPI003569A3AB